MVLSWRCIIIQSDMRTPNILDFCDDGDVTAFPLRPRRCHGAPTALYRYPTEFLLEIDYDLVVLPLRSLRSRSSYGIQTNAEVSTLRSHATL